MGRAYTAADLRAELRAMDRLEMPIAIVQLDEGYEAALGDWLRPRDGFGSLRDAAKQIVATGRTPGIWVSPFLVSEESALFAAHGDWVLPAVSLGRIWNQTMRALDVTRPEVAEHLSLLFHALVDLGFAYFKLAFLFAGAVAGYRHGDASPIAAYRHGLALIREAVGRKP